MDWYLLSVLAFILVLAVLVYRDRRHVERQSILLLRKTQRGKEGLIRLGERWPQFWRAFGTAGAIVGFAASLWILYTLLTLTADAVLRKAAPGFALVLPSLSGSTVVLPGIIAPPFWYWIISIGLLVVVHEGTHGILAAAQRIRLKSLGLGLLAVIPLAFVEPDEKQLQRQPALVQMRVFAGGSFANFLLAGAAFALAALLVAPLYAPAGVGIASTIPGYPADALNLTGVIVSVNGREIRNVTQFNAALDALRPGDAVTLGTVAAPGAAERSAHALVAGESPDKPGKAFIGVRVGNALAVRSELSSAAPAIQFVNGLLFFLTWINLGVGAFNLLPIKGLDGGRMWELALARAGRRRASQILNASTWVLIALILLNFAMALRPA